MITRKQLKENKLTDEEIDKIQIFLISGYDYTDDTESNIGYIKCSLLDVNNFIIEKNSNNDSTITYNFEPLEEIELR